MPDNSWITPYSFPRAACLSSGPSQGMAYALSSDLVVKMPYQYPVNGTASVEAEDHLSLSLQSFQLFEIETTVYERLNQRPHRNVSTKIIGSPKNTIVLARLQPLITAREQYASDRYVLWMYELLDALGHLEGLGLLHGDVKTDNIGIDSEGHLCLFDFGSVTSTEMPGFERQREEDHFALASCIHFIASGRDPMAVTSYHEAKHARSKLQTGGGLVDSAASAYEDIIQQGWRRDRTKPSFSALRDTFLERYNPEGQTSTYACGAMQFQLHELFVPNSEWMEKDQYCAAWTAAGFDVSAAGQSASSV